MKYKDTLNLGKTDFPMRGSLPKTEPARQQKWYDEKLIPKAFGTKRNKATF